MTHEQIVEKVLEAIQAGEKNPVREYEVQDYLKAISYALLGLLERGEDNSRDI